MNKAHKWRRMTVWRLCYLVGRNYYHCGQHETCIKECKCFTRYIFITPVKTDSSFASGISRTATEHTTHHFWENTEPLQHPANKLDPQTHAVYTNSIVCPKQLEAWLVWPGNTVPTFYGTIEMCSGPGKVSTLMPLLPNNGKNSMECALQCIDWWVCAVLPFT